MKAQTTLLDRQQNVVVRKLLKYEPPFAQTLVRCIFSTSSFGANSGSALMLAKELQSLTSYFVRTSETVSGKIRQEGIRVI